MLERFSSFLKKELATFIRERVSFPNGALVSVTRVDVNESFERARVFISVFPEQHADAALKELAEIAREARKFLASRSARHKIPWLEFVRDTGYNAESKVEKLLKKEHNT